MAICVQIYHKNGLQKQVTVNQDLKKVMVSVRESFFSYFSPEKLVDILEKSKDHYIQIEDLHSDYILDTKCKNFPVAFFSKDLTTLAKFYGIHLERKRIIKSGVKCSHLKLSVDNNSHEVIRKEVISRSGDISIPAGGDMSTEKEKDLSDLLEENNVEDILGDLLEEKEITKNTTKKQKRPPIPPDILARVEALAEKNVSESWGERTRNKQINPIEDRKKAELEDLKNKFCEKHPGFSFEGEDKNANACNWDDSANWGFEDKK